MNNNDDALLESELGQRKILNASDLLKTKSSLNEDADSQNEGGDLSNEDEAEASDSEDSSEDDSDVDKDEEALRKVREGFIVDSDEDEEAQNDSESEIRDGSTSAKKRRKKSHKSRQESDHSLSEDDLDLVIENKAQLRSKSRRLKRRKQLALEDELFSSQDEDEGRDTTQSRGNEFYDEFDGFIEDDDEDENDEERSFRAREKDIRRNRMEANKAHRAASANRHASTLSNAAALAAASGGVPGAANLDPDALENLYEIFGDGDDYAFALDGTKKQDNLLAEQEEEEEQDSVSDLNRLAKIFEASELEAKHMTTADELIRLTDAPEYYQLEYGSCDFPDDASIEKNRLEFVLKMLPIRSEVPEALSERYTEALRQVLLFISVEKFDIPLIWHHRSDYLEAKHEGKTYQLLSLSDLWRLLELDVQFRSLNTKLQTFRNTIPDDILEKIDHLMPSITSSLELNDMFDYIQYFYAQNLKKKTPLTKSLYQRYCSSKVYELTKLFGISSEDFCENLKANMRSKYTEDPEFSPKEACNNLDIPEEDMSIALELFANEVFIQPGFRKFLRSNFCNNSAEIYITSQLTPKGKIEIGSESHPLYPVKYLLNRPLDTFKGEPSLFLKLLQAEEESLLEIVITHHNTSRVRQQLIEYLSSDNVSEIARMWNGIRLQIVDKLLAYSHLYTAKVIKDTFKHKFTTQIADYIRSIGCSKIMQRGIDGKVIMAISSPAQNITKGKPLFLSVVVIEESGKLLTHRDGIEQTDSHEFIEILKNFEPDAICIAGNNVGMVHIRETVQQTILNQNIHSKIYWIPDQIARLKQNNKELYPTLSSIGRYCMFLARYALDPLMEYASIGLDGIASLRWHSEQEFVPADRMKRILRSVVVDAVNLVGVDINEATLNSEIASLVPFISGLGPRKSAYIIKKITALGNIRSRTELVTEAIVGKAIFLNCSSFFYIDQDLAGSDGDILDSTRIHNEDYELARKMASDALDLDEEDLLEFESDPSGVIIQLINQNSLDKLDDLILDDYAEQLEKQFKQLKMRTLVQIREELKNPMGEKRPEFADLSPDEIFIMLTGETSQTLHVDAVVPVTLKRTSPTSVFGLLDSGIEIRASKNGLAPFVPGDIVTGRIISVNKAEFRAEADLRREAVAHRYASTSRRPFWNWEAEQRHEQEQIKLEESTNAKQLQRVINHPLFKKFSSKQAEEYLSQMSIGDCVIRPSSRGNDHIVITWKVGPSAYQHVDIREYDKANDYSLGRILEVDKEYKYSDLDELIAMHIKPMAKKIEEMIDHEKFQKGTQEETDQWLNRYTEANPRRSIYAFCYSSGRLGTFDLRFKSSVAGKIGSWPVKVVPNAFSLKGNLYPDMVSLCNGFKILFQNAQKQQLQMQQRREMMNANNPASDYHAAHQYPPHNQPPYGNYPSNYYDRGQYSTYEQSTYNHGGRY